MSRWGVGPVFTSRSIGYGLLMFLISRYFQPVFRIDFVPYWVLSVLGYTLIAMGAPFFIISFKTVSRAYNSNELVTDGVFRFCRHPIYASWVVFIVPGIVLLARSWLGLTTPIFMCLLLRKLVKKEEVYLESVFGSEYLDYKRKVPCILPYGPVRDRRL